MTILSSISLFLELGINLYYFAQVSAVLISSGENNFKFILDRLMLSIILAVSFFLLSLMPMILINVKSFINCS